MRPLGTYSLNHQEFHNLYKHQNCSDYLFDLLTFIEDKLLRITPKKRAKCKEIVEKFEELNNECVKDRDYCMKRDKKTPERTETALSELVAAALPYSDKQNNQIHRNRILEHLGPVEDYSPLNESPDNQSPTSDPDNEPEIKPSMLGRPRPDRKGKMMETKDNPEPSSAELSSMPQKNDAQTTFSDRESNEKQQMSLQSSEIAPLNKGNQQPPGAATERENDAPRDQPLEGSDGNEKQDEVIKEHATRLQPNPESRVILHNPHNPVMLSSTLTVSIPQEHIKVLPNPTQPVESTLVPKQLDFTAKPINSLTEDATKGNTSLKNEDIQNPPLRNPTPTDLLGVDSTDKSTQIQHSNRAGRGEGSHEAVDVEHQKQNIPMTEKLKPLEAHPQPQVLKLAAASETRPRSVKRFLRSLCCPASID